MQMTYDDRTGAVYVYLRKEPVAHTKRISNHTLVDYDAAGEPIGIELLYAPEGIDLAGLSGIPEFAEIERLLSERGFPVLVQ